MLLQGKERERRRCRGWGGYPFVTCVCVCVCVCACSSAYFFRPDVFTVQRFFAFCLVAVMGRFVPLLGTAFFCGTTSTPEEEVEEEEDEEEEELLPSSEVAELSLPLDESSSAEDLDSTELASSSGFQSQSERPREASEKDALSLSTAFATFKVILGFITMGIFLARPFFFSSSCPTITHSVKSTKEQRIQCMVKDGCVVEEIRMQGKQPPNDWTTATLQLPRRR